MTKIRSTDTSNMDDARGKGGGGGGGGPVAEVANQLRGCAGAHQATDPRRGLAQAASGAAMQYQSVFILGANPRGQQ